MSSDQTGEKILFESSPDWKRSSIIEFIVSGLIIIGSVITLISGFSVLSGPDADMAWIVFLIAFCFLLIAIAIPVLAWYRAFCTKLVITDKRIVWKHGMATRLEVDLQHSHIRSVVIQQGLIQRMMEMSWFLPLLLPPPRLSHLAFVIRIISKR